MTYLERVWRAQRKMIPGTFGGRSRAATPQHLNPKRVEPAAPPVDWPPIVPQFVVDSGNGTGPGQNGVPFDYGTYDLAAGMVGVFFILHADASTVSVEYGSQLSSTLISNGSAIGNLRLTVWAWNGPNPDTDVAITLSGLTFNPWAIIYAQTPVTTAAVVENVDATSASPYTIGHTIGPVLGAVVSIGSTTDATVTYPTAGSKVSRNWSNTVDSTVADLTVWASDDGGDFTVTQSNMRRIVLIGDP